ncbi:hypothetical protein [Nocardiopsis metallicus]|uniref:Uncharacterized protein n=1 Tax=Nocardiopsis metallicus TaxID=179819 RepID=A0A840WAE2_9ACTN|nr:hypothetical protein [Nocardiopsis metallicus]MBB5493114.1 hypothetical protein [Nocardiopsis metallicus]
MPGLQAAEAFMMLTSALSTAFLAWLLWQMEKYSSKHQGYRIRQARRPEVLMREAEVYMRALEEEYRNVSGFHERNVRPLGENGRFDPREGTFLDPERASRDLKRVQARQQEIQRNFEAELARVDEEQKLLDDHAVAYWEKELRKNRIFGYVVLAAFFWSSLSFLYAVLFLWL